jgi:dUTP pyrophosphatase
MLDKKVTPYGVYIRKYRIANGIYLGEFAERLQLPVPYLKYLESGDETLPPDLENKLLLYIGFSDKEKINLHAAIEETRKMQEQEAKEIAQMLEDENGVRTPNVIVELDEANLDTGLGGIMPTRAHDNDAGYDLYAKDDFYIDKNDTLMVGLGIHVLIPAGFVGLICPRSSLSKADVNVALGVVDAGYTGEIKVCMNSIYPRYFKRGNRIAQMLILPVVTPELELGNVTGASTERGNGGFGSTGE